MAFGSWVGLHQLRPSVLLTVNAGSQHAAVLLFEVGNIAAMLLSDLLVRLVVVQLCGLLLSRASAPTLFELLLRQLLVCGWILSCPRPRQVVLDARGLSLLAHHVVGLLQVLILFFRVDVRLIIVFRLATLEPRNGLPR